jgi:hypothetical protein
MSKGHASAVLEYMNSRFLIWISPLAVEYLNRRNSQLEDIRMQSVRNHGYIIKPGYGVNQVLWEKQFKKW